MSLQTELQVAIDGTIFKIIETFSLEERVGMHSTFKMTVRADTIEKGLEGTSLLDRSRSFLGKRFAFEINDVGGIGRNMLYFKGKITKVKGKKGNDFGGLGDLIEFTGKSNSILLEDGPHMNSYLEQPLADIVNQATFLYKTEEVKPQIRPENDAMLSYSVQHHQSTFAYLQYLAATQGEYLLYNRETLYFGKPDLGDPVVLRYGVDLKDFSLGVEATPLHFNYYSNDYNSESTLKASSSSMQTGAQGYTAAAAAASQSLYTKQDNQQHYYGFESQQLQQQLDSAVSLQKKLAEQQQVSLLGDSTNTGVTLGKIIQINTKADSFGSYRVTEVTHSYTKGGTYINNFTAVPLEIDVYPLTNIGLMHTAHPQVAKVKAVNDPKGMSRIQVQFPWQSGSGQTTPWIRVATAYAGGDRGLHFLPEVGDEVLVGFENGDVERPFMQAALYTGVNKHNAWQSETNDFKGFQTRSGNKVILNDTTGSVTIADPSGNVIAMQGNGEIVIQAPNKLTLASKDIAILGSNSINIHALPNEEGGQGTMHIYAQKDLGIETADEGIGINANTDVTISSATASANLNAKTDTNLKGNTSVNIDGDAISVTGGREIKIESSDTDIL